MSEQQLEALQAKRGESGMGPAVANFLRWREAPELTVGAIADKDYGRPKGPAPKHRPVSPSGQMNKLERAYQAEVLEPRRLAGEVLHYAFEPMKVQLGDRCYYTPDFYVVTTEWHEWHEVKGHWEDDARVKVKVLAANWPYHRVVAVTRPKGEGWRFEEIAVPRETF